MKNNKHTIDMTQGSILKNILIFVLPMVLGNLLQRFYNAADLIVVSRFSEAGSNAMGSVGVTGAISGIIVNLCLGFSLGCGVLVSRMFGAKDDEGLSSAVHTSVSVSVVIGLCAMAAGIVAARPLLELMNVPEGEVLEGAVLYMRIYFLGVPAMMVYNFGAAILRAVGDTRRPLIILIFTGLLNLILNLLLVIVARWGVAGVAIATSVSNFVSAAVVVILLATSKDGCRLCITKLRMVKSDLLYIAKIGIPSGIQSAMFDIANSFIQSSVNSFGPAAVSGYSAGANIDGIVYTSMTGFSAAALTSVSQNCGAKKWNRVRQTLAVSSVCVSVVGFVVGVVCFAFSRPLLGIYIADSHEAIEFASILLTVLCPTYFLCGLMDVLSGTIRGMGKSFVPMINSLLGACVFRILWALFVLPLNKTPFLLFLCWPISWILIIVMNFVYFMIIRKSVRNQMGMTI